jgi:hypothetical protein
MTAQGPDRSDAYPATGASDPFEARLAGRLATHAEHGVRPIDAAGIATAAAAAGGGASRRGSGLGTALGRLGWLLAGAGLAAAAIGGASWAGSHGLLGAAVESPTPSLVAIVPTQGPSPSPLTAPTEAPTPAAVATPVPIEPCQVKDLAARVTLWSGAAGNRVASVELVNDGPRCSLATTQRPQLVDANDVVLIDGDNPTTLDTIVLAPAEKVSTQLDDANYCGAQPTAPVSVAFVFYGGDQLVAEPWKPTDTFGVPDCLGPGGPGQITMHPWAP